MGDLVGAAFGFPAGIFTFALVVVVGYWVVVVTGLLGVDSLDGDGGVEAHGGFGGALGLGGVPVSVSLSILIAVAWFVSFTGSAVLGQHDIDGFLPDVGLFAAAVVVAWLCARLLGKLLKRRFTDEIPPSVNDFVGRTCSIHTGTVSATFGQAEVHAEDGSSAVVQVRQTGDHTFARGDTALIYEYDAERELFLVVPFDEDGNVI